MEKKYTLELTIDEIEALYVCVMAAHSYSKELMSSLNIVYSALTKASIEKRTEEKINAQR